MDEQSIPIDIHYSKLLGNKRSVVEFDIMMLYRLVD